MDSAWSTVIYVDNINYYLRLCIVSAATLTFVWNEAVGRGQIELDWRVDVKPAEYTEYIRFCLHGIESDKSH